jgi:hypothetical protein
VRYPRHIAITSCKSFFVCQVKAAIRRMRIIDDLPQSAKHAAQLFPVIAPLQEAFCFD